VPLKKIQKNIPYHVVAGVLVVNNAKNAYADLVNKGFKS
jgi:hypothetical protein